MSLTSDEINFLIYRYLRESGFDHSAYAFGHESFVSRSSLDGSGVPPGALISFVQKGLQYVEIESHLTDDGSEIICDEAFSVMKKHECRMKQKRPLHAPYDPLDHDFGPLEIDVAIRIMLSQIATLSPEQRYNKMRALMSTSMSWHRQLPIVALGGADGKVRIWEIKDESALDHKPSGDKRRPRQYSLIQVVDRTGRSWCEEEAEKKARALRRKGNKRQKTDADEKDTTMQSNDSESTTTEALNNHSILALDWHPKEQALAGGSYDGTAFIWNSKGDLLHTLTHHTAPITVLKFNRSGDRLLTCSVDQSVCVWDFHTGKIIQQYLVHSGPVIDADWSSQEDNVFATAGTGGQLFLYNDSTPVPATTATTTATVTETTTTANSTDAPHAPTANGTAPPAADSAPATREPRALIGHTGDINSVRFDPSGSYLATGSDDRTARVWSSETGEAVQTLTDATGPVTVVRFMLPEPIHLTEHTAPPLILAVASADTTCRLYDLSTGKLSHVLARHSHPLTAVAFQPGNALLATASHDRVHIWTTSDGQLVKTFRSEGEGGVNDLQFDVAGRRLAITYADGINYVIPLDLTIKS